MAKCGAKVCGIDISEVSIKNCQAKAIQQGLEKNITFKIMDAETLDFKEDSFDIIVCSGVLHHLDIKKAYVELARVLKPEGEIICAEPLKYNPFIQLYRRMTPHLRTEWETEHILGMKEINLAKKYFAKVEARFFHLATLAAVPWRNWRGFNFILSLLETLDNLILKIPFLREQAWMVVFILSGPKK
jgi:ubiquinone/menaquinone biosynthesis C-methylase UbiE